MRSELDQLLINRLSTEIGTLRAQLIESQLYNEILMRQNRELQEKLDAFSATEVGEGNSEGGE